MHCSARDILRVFEHDKLYELGDVQERCEHFK